MNIQNVKARKFKSFNSNSFYSYLNPTLSIITASGLLAMGAISCNNPVNSPKEKPNIIFILADDLGYTDICSFASNITGSPVSDMFYETPNIDRLAANGIAFSQAYACPLCSPTRSSLLTGKYAARTGFTTAVPFFKTYYNDPQPLPDGYYIHDEINHIDPVGIPRAWNNATSNTAIPRGYEIDDGRNETILTDVLKDYHSAFIGKWHVGGVGADGYSPVDMGFVSPAWYDAGGSHYFNWRNAWNDRSKETFPNIPQDDWVRGDAGKLTEHEYLTDDLTEKAVEFIQEQAQHKEKPFFLYLCHFAVHTPIQAPEEEIEYFDSKETKGWNGHNNSTYAGMIKRLDNSVGRIMKTLEETGLNKNTLVVFMSDNGGVDKQFFKVQPVVTSNSPLKAGKATVFEGGIRVPLIFSWPGNIKSGQWCDKAIDVNDLFPTLLEVSGHSTAGMDIDGESLIPLWSDPANLENNYSRNTFFWHYPFNVSVNNPDDRFPLTPHSAIRKGDYKLIFDWHGRLKLYNIREDISELTNLAKVKPELTRELFSELIAFLETNVEKRYWPVLNPDYNPAEEVRDAAFVNLYKAFKEGKDIVELANL